MEDYQVVFYECLRDKEINFVGRNMFLMRMVWISV